jgi:hypothetical protein
VFTRGSVRDCQLASLPSNCYPGVQLGVSCGRDPSQKLVKLPTVHWHSDTEHYVCPAWKQGIDSVASAARHRRIRNGAKDSVQLMALPARLWPGILLARRAWPPMVGQPCRRTALPYTPWPARHWHASERRCATLFSAAASQRGGSHCIAAGLARASSTLTTEAYDPAQLSDEPQVRASVGASCVHACPIQAL